MVKYSRQPAEATKTAKSKVKDQRAHFKNTYNTANAVRGMKIKKAIAYMDQVLDHKAIIGFTKQTFSSNKDITMLAKMRIVTTFLNEYI